MKNRTTLIMIIAMIMIIAPNSRARKGGKEREEREYGSISREEEGNDATQSATCVKGIECGLDTRGLIMVAAF